MRFSNFTTTVAQEQNCLCQETVHVEPGHHLMGTSQRRRLPWRWGLKGLSQSWAMAPMKCLLQFIKCKHTQMYDKTLWINVSAPDQIRKLGYLGVHRPRATKIWFHERRSACFLGGGKDARARASHGGGGRGSPKLVSGATHPAFPLGATHVGVGSWVTVKAKNSWRKVGQD